MILLIPLFFIALVIYVSMPLFTTVQGARARRSRAEETMRDGQRRKESILQELHDIEMDFLTHKLSEEDFRALKQTYEDKLIVLLKKK